MTVHHSQAMFGTVGAEAYGADVGHLAERAAAPSRMSVAPSPPSARQVVGQAAKALTDDAGCDAAVQMVTRSARRDLLQVIGVVPAGGHGLPTAQQASPADRTLRRRTIVATQAICRPMPVARMTELRRTGGELATSDDLPVQAVIADESVAVVSVGADDDRATVLLRAPGMVRMVRQWAENIWAQATPLRAANPSIERGVAAVSHPSTVAKPTTVDPASGRTDHSSAGVLERLAAGMTDEAIGRAMGISARTVRRRVAELETRFSATNRIQLVARAATQGWITV